MRFSLVVLISFLCFVVVVHCATTKTTQKRQATTMKTKTSKAPARQSAYAYLRSVRGNRSCTTGTCPFWERHGRSFAALRCYSQQYQECVCLHRMCFSSCLFTREVCNQEMVSCLRQICPRCLPPSSLPMCAVYDSMAERVADALSVFACYPCCPMMPNQQGNATMTTTTPTIGLTTTPAASPTETPVAITTTTPMALATDPLATTTSAISEVLTTTAAAEGSVLPGAEGAAAAAAAVPNRNQRVQPTVRTTKRAMTTRRIASTTRLPSSTSKTNQVKNIPQASVKTTKKPQSSVRPKS